MLPWVFSDRQKKIMAAALTTVSLVVMVAIILWLASLILLFFVRFSGVFLPLAVAAIVATLLKPYYGWLRDRLKSDNLAMVAVLVSFILPVLAVFYYFGVMIVQQVSGLLNELPVWIDRGQAWAQEQLPLLRDWIARHGLKERLSAWMHGKGDLLASSASVLGQGVVSTGSFVFQSVTGLLGWLVLPVYVVFMLRAPSLRREDIEKHLPFLKPETRANAVYLVTEFAGIMVAFFRGQLVIAFCQGLLFAVGFSLVGVPHGAVLGFLLGLLNIVPYLGNIIGLAVVLPLAWFSPEGGLTMLAAVGVVFVLVQCIEGYLLTPRIMGQTTGLHPMTIIVAILFWGSALNGLLGMILAIPLTAFLVVVWRLLRSQYIKEWI
jgi:predicted PurR-regulated permease PerM